jgi:putative two-component system response regulator
MLTPHNATILIVDDSPENLMVLTELLSPHYRVLAAQSGEKCLRIVSADPKPDLILLDVMMPGMDGYEVLRQLRQSPISSRIPVVLLTALADPQSEEFGLSLGAADYITKPIKPVVVQARVRTQLEAKQARDGLQNQNAALEAEVARRMAENDLIQQVSIRALAHLAEIRDPETGNHILRTQGYVRLLASALADHPRFADTLTPGYIDLLSRSAPLYDIGKTWTEYKNWHEKKKDGTTNYTIVAMASLIQLKDKNGNKEYQGILKAFDQENIELEENIKIERKNIAQIKTVYNW